MRSDEKHTLGHIRDRRRINVALTRARDAVIVTGDIATLRNDFDVWRKYVADYEDCIMQLDTFYDWFRP